MGRDRSADPITASADIDTRGVALRGCAFTFATERKVSKTVVHATAQRGGALARWQFQMPRRGDHEALVETVIYPAMWDFIEMTDPLAGARDS
jgi:hypothetical protein